MDSITDLNLAFVSAQNGITSTSTQTTTGNTSTSAKHIVYGSNCTR
ncbi:hypothetical protein ACJDU8_25050 [Clostridium sp. WILCCON 0269]|uniref:Uncharacterized protein n=1 Tax=Candidatus Clostridium eludens TaxID=3381663 RepID=A0ABW8SSA2_9CLOT